MAATWDGPKSSPTLQYCSVPQAYVNPSNDNAGFTKVIKSHDTKVFYVSDSNPNSTDDPFNTGEDPNTPLKTIAEGVSRLRAGFPDHLLLDSNDDFSDQASFTDCPDGRSPSEPIVLGTYNGTGRPRVNIVDWANTGNPNRQNIHLLGMHFYLQRTQPSQVIADIEADLPFPNSTYDAKDSKGAMRTYDGFGSLVFEDNVFDHIETLFKGVDGDNPGDGLRLRRNIYTGAYIASSNTQSDTRPSNIYMESCSYVHMEENVVDYGGWFPTVQAWRGGTDTGDPANDFLSASANSRNHNVYIQYNCRGDSMSVVNNILSRGSSHGVQQRGGGICDNNFLGRNAIGAYMNDTTLVGTPDIDGYYPDRQELTNNWASEGSSQYKPADITGFNRTGAVWGLEYHAYRGIVENIVWNGNFGSLLDPNDTDASVTRTLRAYEFQAPQGGTSTPIQNGARYHWDTPTQGDTDGYPDPNRSLGTYYQKLVTDGDLTGTEPGSDDYDKLMGVVKSRAKGSWDIKLTASAINDYGRAGYGITPYPR